LDRGQRGKAAGSGVARKHVKTSSSTPTARRSIDIGPLFHTEDFAFRPADFATLTSLQMRPVTSSRSGTRLSRSAKNRSASSTRCTSVDDYRMSLPRIELGNINQPDDR
jgi:hypothetical protein